jgi:hypothetical protein
MAHFALLDENNNVIQIDAVNNEVVNNLPFPESESIGIAFLKSVYGEATNWLQTSYNNNFRGIYATVGGFYDPELDLFVSIKLHASWVRTQTGTAWEPPIPYPDDGKDYLWNEDTVAWVEVIRNQDEPTQV